MATKPHLLFILQSNKVKSKKSYKTPTYLATPHQSHQTDSLFYDSYKVTHDSAWVALTL